MMLTLDLSLGFDKCHIQFMLAYQEYLEKEHPELYQRYVETMASFGAPVKEVTDEG
jgi:hypothetical protein